jgi:hypothetical protein
MPVIPRDPRLPPLAPLLGAAKQNALLKSFYSMIKFFVLDGLLR